MWKLYLIEILGDLPLVLFAIGAGLFLYWWLDEDWINLKPRTILILSVALLSLSTLMPSKKFMYITLGISETIEFLNSNEEAKSISSKTIKLINKKLDKYLEEDDRD
ncbi:MAG: hypothetical protein ACRC9P_07440 [Bacteroides sp.]